MKQIRSIAILGAGTMGSQIAAHMANAGLPTLLLDIDKQTALMGLQRAKKLKPAPFFSEDCEALVTVGGFESHLTQLQEYDWIVEAIVEQVDAKRQLLERVDAVRAPGTIVSSNTSGIPIIDITRERSNDFRKYCLGTHFFNPPRYLSLLEIIPTRETDPSVVDDLMHFCDHRLGKGVIIAKDTPNFIANRIGVFSAIQTLKLLGQGNVTVEEVDAITGPVIGRPKSATCRTVDIAGLDILVQVAKNIAGRLTSIEEREAFAPPAFLNEMVEQGRIGAKVGEGFYKRVRQNNKNRILTFDLATMDYRERLEVQLASLDAINSRDDLGQRTRQLFIGKDPVGKFLRASLGQTLLYSATVASEIAHSIDDVDRALRWGFGWELGPFELWDAIGIDTILDVCGVATPPELVADLLKNKTPSGGDPIRFRKHLQLEPDPELQLLRSSRERSKIVQSNKGASLVDVGHGVLVLEFHSKMNTIDGDTVAMLTAGVSEATANFDALIIANDAENFSVGANLSFVLNAAKDGHWNQIDGMVKSFQDAVIGLRYSEVPVVAVPSGLTLGGGCEIALHSARAQASAETYMGQVEVGVGLIPAGGGTKELLVRFTNGIQFGVGDPLPLIQRVFQLIGFGKVSASAEEAKHLGLLREIDGITMRRERLLHSAVKVATELAKTGYQRPRTKQNIAVGGNDIRAALDLSVHLALRAGRLSEHDALIGRTLSRILAGGDIPHATTVTENHLLDLEREAFLSLCGETRTQDRMTHMLTTGKTLRN